jgi:predicted glycoside hydrolase/deacetylase ChbG (UPF0249 family)
MSANSLLPGLIINADDLGIHPQINSGILSAYRNGALTSCTMLMTTPYLEETARAFVKPAVMPIGIHLSLTLGRAIARADRIPRLVDSRGCFKLSAAELVFMSFKSEKRRHLLREITQELDAQLALAHDFGLRPTHADSHQHVHMNPAIFAVVEDLLIRYGIQRLRYCREDFALSALGPDFPLLLTRLNHAKWALLRWRCAQVRPRLLVPDRMFGVLYTGMMNKRALKSAIARSAPDKAMEVCVHPGFPAAADEAPYDRPAYNTFISDKARQSEYDLLVDCELASFIRQRGLHLRSFDGLLKEI